MCQVPESEAVKLWSVATCVAACFPGGEGGWFKVVCVGK